MFMEGTVWHARQWSWGLLVACLLGVTTIAYGILGFITTKNQSVYINVILQALNQTSSADVVFATANGAMGIVQATLAATLGLIALLVGGSQLLRSIQKDDTSLTSSCKARLEKMQGIYSNIGEDGINQIIQKARVFSAGEAPPNLAELREEVDECTRILEKIEYAANVLHGGQDPRG